jgi:aconitase B
MTTTATTTPSIKVDKSVPSRRQVVQSVARLHSHFSLHHAAATTTLSLNQNNNGTDISTISLPPAHHHAHSHPPVLVHTLGLLKRKRKGVRD